MGQKGNRETSRIIERRPRWGTLALVLVFHVFAIGGLIRAFAPGLPGQLIEHATSLVSVNLAPPPPPSPEPSPKPRPQPPAPDEGAAAPKGKRATPREVLAVQPPIELPRPNVAPPLASTGTANAAGAAESGSGTGGGGEGSGTGSGGAGSGPGGMDITDPVKIGGNISDARDYPVPPGGRKARKGQHVIVHRLVGIDGRARDCRVVKPSTDPVADSITCRLAEERFRFRPARDAQGNPVPALYGWRQDWF